jgi:hypothetical protein
MLFSIPFPIFLINHLYSTFASPIVSRGGVAAGQSLKLMHSLAKRVYIPPDQLCDNPDDWVSRECVTGLSDLEWEDNCHTDADVIYLRVGECPEDTMCQNTLVQDENDEEPIETISCISRPRNNNVVAPDQQSGVSRLSNTSSGESGPSQRTLSVMVETNLVDATVSGLVEATDDNYVIPSSIVATLRGTTTKLCDYNETNRDCVPTGRHTITAGNAIDFKFIFAGFQTVFLYYAIIAPTKLNGGNGMVEQEQ